MNGDPSDHQVQPIYREGEKRLQVRTPKPTKVYQADVELLLKTEVRTMDFVSLSAY